MTKEKFEELVGLGDKFKDELSDKAGRINAFEDGEIELTDKEDRELERHCEALNEKLYMIAEDLRVPYQFFDEILDSCVVNRWELYRKLIGGR